MITRQRTEKQPATIKRVSFPENLLFDENPKKCRTTRSLDFGVASNKLPSAWTLKEMPAQSSNLLQGTVTNLPVQAQQDFTLPDVGLSQSLSSIRRPHWQFIPLAMPHQQETAQNIMIVKNEEGQIFVHGMQPGFKMFRANGQYHVYKVKDVREATKQVSQSLEQLLPTPAAAIQMPTEPDKQPAQNVSRQCVFCGAIDKQIFYHFQDKWNKWVLPQYDHLQPKYVCPEHFDPQPTEENWTQVMPNKNVAVRKVGQSKRKPLATVTNTNKAVEAKEQTDNDVVVFLVGVNRDRVLVLKHVLVKTSNLFRKMFSREIGRKHTEILAEDIQPDVFVEVVNFINGRDVKLTPVNVWEVLYAAHKYIIPTLKLTCGMLIGKTITSENMLLVLERNQPFNCAVVADKCFAMLFSDPIKYFKQDQFLNINADLLTVILKKPRFNCTVHTLERAAKKWLIFNEFTDDDKNPNDFYEVLTSTLGVTETEMRCKQYYNLSRSCDDGNFTKNFQNITEHFSLRDCYLHGISLVVGVFPSEQEINENFYTDTVKITIHLANDNRLVKKCVRYLNQMNESLNTIDIMFEKVLIEDNFHDDDEVNERHEDDKNIDHMIAGRTIKIEVDFGTKKNRAVIKKHKEINNDIKHRRYSRYRSLNERTCIFYSSVISSLMYTRK